MPMEQIYKDILLKASMGGYGDLTESELKWLLKTLAELDVELQSYYCETCESMTHGCCDNCETGLGKPAKSVIR